MSHTSDIDCSGVYGLRMRVIFIEIEEVLVSTCCRGAFEVMGCGRLLGRQSV